MDRFKDTPSQGTSRPGGFSFNAQEARELSLQRSSINRKDPVVLATKAPTLYRSAEKWVKAGTKTIKEARIPHVDLDLIVIGSETSAIVAGLGAIVYGASTPNAEFVKYGVVSLVGSLSLILAQAANYEC